MIVMRIGHQPGDIQTVNIPDQPYDSLKAMQEMVGGWIEPCAPAQLREKRIELLANEEGLLTQQPLNQNLWPFFLVGNLVAVGVYGEDFGSLSLEQIAFVKSWLKGLDN